MRFHCGISFSWRTIKKILIPILIGLLGCFGFKFINDKFELGFIKVNALENEQNVIVAPSSVYYNNDSVSPYTFYPNITDNSYLYYYSPNNTISNAYNFTLEYTTHNYCVDTNHKGYLITMFSTGYNFDPQVSITLLNGGEEVYYTLTNDNIYYYITTENIDFSKDLKIIVNSLSRSRVDTFYFRDYLTISCEDNTPAPPEPCPDCPDCPDSTCCEDNTNHKPLFDKIYWFDDNSTSIGILSSIYILLFLYCITMIFLRIITLIKGNKW